MSQPDDGYQPGSYTPNPAYQAQPQPTTIEPYPQSPAGWQPQPYSPGPYPPAQPVYVAAPPVRPTSGLATASMICGIAGLLLFCLVIPSLVAVTTGHSAMKETRTGERGGHGQAIAGLILGYVVLIPMVAWGVIALVGLLAGAADSATTTP